MAGPGPEVSLEDQIEKLRHSGGRGLREVVGWDAATTPWVVAEEIAAGDAPRALLGIETLFSGGFQEKSGRRLLDGVALAADFSGRSFQVGVGDRIDAVEKRLILATVQHTHTKEAAAEILGISVKTLYNRLRAYESGADLARTPPAHGTTQAPPAGAPSSSETPPRTPAT